MGVTITAKEAAKNAIKKDEGLSSKVANKNSYFSLPSLVSDDTIIYAYYDTGGVATIGYGTTHYPSGAAVQITDKRTHGECKSYLDHEFNLKYDEIKSKSVRPIKDNELSAFTRLAYNIGRSAFFGSTLWRLWTEGKPANTVAAQFDLWVKDNGKVVQGLVNRRASEKSQFLA